MNTPTRSDTTDPSARRGLRWTHVLAIVLVTIAATAGATYWFLNNYLLLKEFKPVRLQPEEEQVLNNKLRAAGIRVKSGNAEQPPLKPERYSEVGATREIEFSERELNAILAKNTDLAQKLAIDLSEDLVSAKLLIPLAQDFPFLGGRTLRVNAGMEMAYGDRRPIVKLRGISVMGVPIPNAWLGNMKNVDLVREFGGDPSFWKSFADGIEYVRVKDDRLLLKLKE